VTGTSPRRRARLTRVAAIVGALGFLLAACTQEYDYNTLAPAGPVAEKQADLFALVFWIATGVFIVVEGLLVFALFRFRRRSAEDQPKQIHGNTRLEIAWTIVPALLLAGVAVPTIGTIFDTAGCGGEGEVQVEVEGYQWWWEVRYPDLGVTTANEIHIPAEEPVCVRITSGDVIHSFWVPRLAGKQDLVPGRTAELVIAANEPGVYEGECAEYCGLSHTIMLFEVVAQEPSEFQAWVDRQRQPAARPAPGSELENTIQQCLACHAIDGLGAPPPGGQPAPNLTHVGSRRTIVGGWLENTPENLARWLRNPPRVKPGSLMPNYRLTDEQIEDLVEYLGSLQ
jgi:cytochrome c oxidase subunit 2